MEKNDFKKSLKVSNIEQITNNSTIDEPSIEALYLYTSKSLDEIIYFLRDFYEENPTQDVIEHDDMPSHAESYYYSLRFEIDHAYSDFLNGKLSIEQFKEKFNNFCSQYKTNPLTILKTSKLVMEAKENSTQNDLDTLVNSLEAQADEYWEKMKEDKESQK